MHSKSSLIYQTLGSFIEISSKITSRQIAFTLHDSIRDLLGFKPVIIHEEFNLTHYPVRILPLNEIFIETDIAHGKIFKGKRSGIIFVDADFNYIE